MLEDLKFILCQHACFNQVRHQRKSFLDSRWQNSKDHRERQTHISHDCSSHSSTNFVEAVNRARDVGRDSVGPRNRNVLIPPSSCDIGDEESEKKWDRNDLLEVSWIFHDNSENFLSSVIQEEVDYLKDVEQRQVDQQLLIEQSEEGSAPTQEKQFEVGSQLCCGYWMVSRKVRTDSVMNLISFLLSSEYVTVILSRFVVCLCRCAKTTAIKLSARPASWNL